jgi:hypothetical protein
MPMSVHGQKKSCTTHTKFTYEKNPNRSNAFLYEKVQDKWESNIPNSNSCQGTVWCYAVPTFYTRQILIERSSVSGATIQIKTAKSPRSQSTSPPPRTQQRKKSPTRTLIPTKSKLSGEIGEGIGGPPLGARDGGGVRRLLPPANLDRDGRIIGQVWLCFPPRPAAAWTAPATSGRHGRVAEHGLEPHTQP